MQRLALLLFGALFFLTSCASSTKSGEVGMDRKQLLLVSDPRVLSMAARSYDQTKEEAAQRDQLDKNPEEVRRVTAVMMRLIPQTETFREGASQWPWEVHVITSPDLNAYCLPGGKIIFYSGIIEKMHLTDGEIAAIMGHEISHALREHGRERMSEELLEQIGIEALVASGRLDDKYAGAANTVTSVMISLPHSRRQETEADEMGLELMARAGYNPEEALNLWRKMAAMGGSKPPELLSDHPADEARLEKLQSLLPKVMPLYQPR